MSNVDARREDFPLSTFRYLETKLKVIRRRVMDVAVEIAREEQKTAIYTVHQKYIDDALVLLLGEPDKIRKLLDLMREGS